MFKRLLLVLVLTVAVFIAGCLPVSEQDPHDVASTLDAPVIHTIPPTATFVFPAIFRVAFSGRTLTFEKLGNFTDVSASYALFHPNGTPTAYSGLIDHGKYAIDEVEEGSILVLSGEKFILNSGLTTGFTQDAASIK